MHFNVNLKGTPAYVLAWTSVRCITVKSRGEPPEHDKTQQQQQNTSSTTTSTTPAPPLTSRSFTQALQLLERMLVSQERQRRLIPYYSYYVLNDRNSLNYQHPTPTPFPVQNTPLDLLARSIFAPYPNFQTSYVQQSQYTPSKYTYTNILHDFSRPRGFAKYPLDPLTSTKHPLDLLAPTKHPLDILTPTKHPLDLLIPAKSYSHTFQFPEDHLSPTQFQYPDPTVAPPSLPRLLSPLASVTRFPVPKVQKQNKNAPGRPGVDYPTFYKIPPTSFSCRTQRYKGFFADPETSCQVWHYCDLNGGQASFLCPNGTIFSQVLLTCDWWFNVKCTNSLQAYVLNERLYKYITPKKPSFPEDFTGLQVDDYLTQKLPELREKELAKAERLKKKYKPFEFDDVDALQELLDKMRNGEPLDDSLEKTESTEEVKK